MWHSKPKLCFLLHLFPTVSWPWLQVCSLAHCDTGSRSFYSCSPKIIQRNESLLSSMDSDLEAFSHNPTDGGFSAKCKCQLSESAVPLLLSRITIATTLQQYGKTNLSHDGLNPACVPYWRVNNLMLGKFCFAMEGLKSNVAMNAWLPQASYYVITVRVYH